MRCWSNINALIGHAAALYRLTGGPGNVAARGADLGYYAKPGLTDTIVRLFERHAGPPSLRSAPYEFETRMTKQTACFHRLCEASRPQARHPMKFYSETRLPSKLMVLPDSCRWSRGFVSNQRHLPVQMPFIRYVELGSPGAALHLRSAPCAA